MVVLGIVLIVLAVLLGLGVSVSSSDSTTMSVFGVDFGMVVPTLFFIGAAAGVALVIGLWLTKKGLGRGYRRHKEVKELRQQVAAAPATETEPTTASSPTAATADSATAGPATAGETADDPDSRTVEIGSDEQVASGPTEAERLAGERHNVADGTDTKQPH
ncbi:hypothetical protein [Kribbella sp. VKM Ac-2568]|uniref:hypothetical protein n=1 Tax=Kribbella sp. VKM Ac-2568 TaxID=2512219 RepID=UPI0010491125|nr:hypothetical protein [Kribbella sp. VKM Ac-2568]TCM49107.1 hypothetical protein EV648_103376 [Kribbella sp. VKM Ac-2568]